jgi:lipid-A-disaccharide synthase
VKFIISGKNHLVYEYFTQQPPEIKRYMKVSYDEGVLLMKAADAGMICSGTATLEAALSGLPFLGVYMTSGLNYTIAKATLDIDMILLPNIILGRKEVSEFIQSDASPEALSEEVLKLLKDRDYRKKLQQSFDKLRAKLGEGRSSEKVARSINSYLVSLE